MFGINKLWFRCGWPRPSPYAKECWPEHRFVCGNGMSRQHCSGWLGPVTAPQKMSLSWQQKGGIPTSPHSEYSRGDETSGPIQMCPRTAKNIMDLLFLYLRKEMGLAERGENSFLQWTGAATPRQPPSPVAEQFCGPGCSFMGHSYTENPHPPLTG